MKIPLFHWSLTPTGVKGAVGIIFDMVFLLTAILKLENIFFLDIINEKKVFGVEVRYQ
jgi:hypothetical protein